MLTAQEHVIDEADSITSLSLSRDSRRAMPLRVQLNSTTAEESEHPQACACTCACACACHVHVHAHAHVHTLAPLALDLMWPCYQALARQYSV